MTTATTNAIAQLMRHEIAEELSDLLKVLRPSNLNVYEMAGLLTILRGAMDREFPADESPAAPVLELVKTGKVSR